MHNLEILKRILIDGVPYERLRRKFFKGTLRGFEEYHILSEGIRNSYVQDGRILPVRAETMIGKPRLDNFQFCIENAVKNNIDGDIIETGVWRGGACILAAAVVKNLSSDKAIFVADSFEGLPEPEEQVYPADEDDEHYLEDRLKVSLDQVKENFRSYGLLNDNVVFIKGFFKDTLHVAPIDKLSVLRLDGDMYSSTWETLTALYDKVSDGGYVIIDDYFLPACKKAVDDFRKLKGIRDRISIIDWTGVFWIKNESRTSPMDPGTRICEFRILRIAE